MSEEIKAVLSSDPKAFEAGIERALESLTNLEKRVAKPQKAALPILDLSPALLAQLESAGARTQDLANRTMMAGRAGQMGSMGFLAFSQAVEDAQYGIRGVLNNIPGMVLGFGGGMGLAGALSLASVAAATLYPHLKKLNGEAYNEAAAKGAEEWARIFKEGMAAANAIEAEAASASRLLEIAQMLSDAYAERVGYVGQMQGYWDKELASMRSARDYQIEQLEARRQMVETLGGDPTDLISNKQSLESSGVAADLQNRRKELELQLDIAQKIAEARPNIAAENTAREAAATAELSTRTKELADSKGRLAAMQEEAKAAGDKERESIDLNSRIVEANITKLEERIETLKTERETYRKAGEAAASEAEKNAEAANSKIQKTNEEIKALEEKQKRLVEIHRLELQKIEVGQMKTELAATKEARPDLEKEVEVTKERQQATRTLVDDMKVMRTTAKWGRKPGDDLREELNLQKEAKEIEGKTFLNHDEALKLAKERKQLEEDIAKIPKGSIKERADARAAERAAKREEQRNDRVAEAQRKRDARDEKGKPVDFNKDRLNLDKVLQDAERKRAESEKTMAENSTKQLELVDKIHKAIANITSK